MSIVKVVGGEGMGETPAQPLTAGVPPAGFFTRGTVRLNETTWFFQGVIMLAVWLSLMRCLLKG